MPRVLVADDSELDLQLTRRALRKALPEWEIDAAEDGAAAERQLNAGEPPSLVLLDFRMPGMGAPEVLATTTESFRADVPIVLFSSSVSPTDVARCVALGAREYIEKPTDPSAYADAVTDICRRWAAGS
jgi:CheY-like chemotaxis protein